MVSFSSPPYIRQPLLHTLEWAAARGACYLFMIRHKRPLCKSEAAHFCKGGSGMKQKNGAWLLALAAMLCSIGGV